MPIRSNLKRLVTLMLCALCVLSALTSCFYLPDAEEKYDVTFYDTYAVKDYNLFYLDANAHDGMIKTKSDQEYDWDRLYVATIPETSEAQFVIGIRETYYITGGNSNHFCIYQSKDAPIPRKDWTFSEIKIIKNDWVGGPSRSNPNYKSYYRDMIEGSSYDYSWLESGADPVLAEELHTSFGSALIKNSEKKCRTIIAEKPDKGSYQYYILCVTFEENPHMAWMATIYVADDGYYLGRFNEERDTEHFYAMGESWNLLLEEMIHGMEQFETDTAESE